jgi:hypothetical protein
VRDHHGTLGTSAAHAETASKCEMPRTIMNPDCKGGRWTWVLLETCDFWLPVLAGYDQERTIERGNFGLRSGTNYILVLICVSEVRVKRSYAWRSSPAATTGCEPAYAVGRICKVCITHIPAHPI